MGRFELGGGKYGVLEPCPEVLYWEPQLPVQRFTVYLNDEKVLHWDVYLTDEVRYEMNLFVERNFRDGEWMRLLTECDPGSLQFFSRLTGAWMRANQMVADDENELIAMHTEMTAKNIMRTGRFMAEGAINKIIPIETY